MIERFNKSLDSQLPQDEFYARVYKAPTEVQTTPSSNIIALWSMGGAVVLPLITTVGFESMAYLSDRPALGIAPYGLNDTGAVAALLIMGAVGAVYGTIMGAVDEQYKKKELTNY